MGSNIDELSNLTSTIAEIKPSITIQENISTITIQQSDELDV